MVRLTKDEVGRKETRSFGLSPWMIEKIDKSVNSGDYTGKSDLASVAFTEHFLLEDQRTRDEKMFKIYRLILDNIPYEIILKEVQVDRASRIEALKKKGVLCVELGDLEGAQECFREVKELENPNSKKQGVRGNKNISIENGTIEDENVDF